MGDDVCVCVRGWVRGRVVEWVSWCVDDDDNALYDPAYRHRILWWRGAIPHGSPHTHTALPTRPRPSSPLISPPSPSCGGCSAMLCVSEWVHGPDVCGSQGPCIVHYEAPRGRREYRGCDRRSCDSPSPLHPNPTVRSPAPAPPTPSSHPHSCAW